MHSAALTGTKPVGQDTPAASADLAVIKARQKAAWSSGNYAVVGTTLQIVGEQLCYSVESSVNSVGICQRIGEPIGEQPSAHWRHRLINDGQ